MQTVDELSASVQDLELDGKGVPVLIRQYAKIGGQFLGFNVDPLLKCVGCAGNGGFTSGRKGNVGEVDGEERSAGVSGKARSKERARAVDRH